MRQTAWSNDWRTTLLIKIMTRVLEVQADYKCMMINVTEHDALVPDEYIAQGSSELGAELQKLMQDEMAKFQELDRIREEERV